MPSRHPGRREDHGRLQGGSVVEEWVGKDAGLVTGGAHTAVWLRFRRKGKGKSGRPLTPGKAGLKNFIRVCIQLQTALNAVFRGLDLALQETGATGTFSLLHFPGQRRALVLAI